jgi:hypothetical protein
MTSLAWKRIVALCRSRKGTNAPSSHAKAYQKPLGSDPGACRQTVVSQFD